MTNDRSRGLKVKSKRSRLRQLALENLEARTLMATAPLPIISGQASITSATNTSNDGSPWVAVDPVNPLKMVMAYTHHDPNNSQIFGTPIVAQAKFSVDGGKTWSTLGLPNNKFDVSTSNPTVQYTQGFAQGVGIDQNENVYIGVLQNDSADTSGAVLTEKFSFLSSTPVRLSENTVYQWNRSDSAVMNASLETAVENFNLAVDGNAPTFTDPKTGAKQTDANSGAVYIAATLDTPPPPSPPSPWNRYTVGFSASTNGSAFTAGDGGLGIIPVPFTNIDQNETNGGSPNVGNQHETDPRIVVSQGRVGGLNGANDGGEVTVIWDDYGTGAGASPAFDQIDDRGIVFNKASSSLQLGVYGTVANTLVRGALNLQGTAAPYSVPSAVSPVGIGPGASIAVDNTLGSFSLHEGRIYVTYVNRPNYTDANNPIDNTDVFLSHSDDDGKTWSAPVQVNSDDGTVDGHTGAVTGADLQAGYANHPNGRPQFLPSVAVDRATGGVALTWLDGRDDPTVTRVATYLTESIDGGATFSPQTYLNTPNSVTDGITAKSVSLGPIADNLSGSNAKADTTLGYGYQLAVTFANGAVRAYWPSNHDAINGRLLTIQTAAATYVAGPRVISSTMGTAKSTTVDGFTFNNTFSAADHTPQLDGFSVTFDRPVDVATFQSLAAGQVKVFFNSPSNITDTPIAIAGVTPLDSFFGGVEATTFFVRFSAPQSAVGTYSYSVGNYPSASTPGIQDDMPNPGVVSILPDGTNTVYPAPPSQVGKVIPPYNGGPSKITSTISITTAPAAQLVQSLTASLNITHNFDGDLLITLTSPRGVTATLISQRGGSGHDFSNTTLDDAAGTSIAAGAAPFSGAFRPESPLSVFAGETVDGNWVLTIQDTVNDPNDTGLLNAWSLDIIGETRTIVLGATGNKLDQNANGLPGQPSDTYYAPAPLSGSTPLPPFNPSTSPLIVPGPSVASTFVPDPATGAAISSGADNLVLNTAVTTLDVTFDRNMNGAVGTFSGTLGTAISILGPNGPVSGTFTFAPDPPAGEDPTFPRTFRITFPSQQASGTYAVTINPDPRIQSEAGDEVDANQNAGLSLLFNQGTVGSTIATNLYQARNVATGSTTNLGVTIPANSTVTSSITITDAYLIQNLLLTLNITYPNDPDLTATLSVAPLADPTNPTATVTLFSNVGNVGAAGTRRNFTNTVFTDQPTTSTGAPTTAIGNGAPPFFGQFLPAQPAAYAALVGTEVQGVWTLTITNAGTTPASVGTLNSWSLTVGQTVGISTGIGEPVADRTSTGFRLFTMDPTNPNSSNALTAVGPASANNNDNAGSASVVAVDPSDPSGNTAYVGGSSGGVWKTTNFLTTSANGPTYVPLTNSGPANAANVGSIAVFDRNNDPNQTVVLVGTGNGNLVNPTGRHGNASISQGAGFLISYNGGLTWTVLDSKVNVVNGQEVPESTRDRTFVGATIYKVLADPNTSPSNGVIFYAAVSSPNAGVGGIYRTFDGGQTWTNVRPGNATDVVFDQNSNVINAVSNPNGNIRTLYAAFAGDGVYMTPNQGQTWSKMGGGLGDPLYREVTTNAPVPVANNPNPSGQGRITLARAALTGNPILDTQYETWLYAAVSNVGGAGFNGLYLTKDNGSNWTLIQLPDAAFDYLNGSPREVNPTNNDTGANNYNVTRSEGTYDLSLAVDPGNPSVVYLGGNADAQPTTLIRVDSSRLADPYSLTVDTSRLGGGQLDLTTDPVTPRTVPNADFNPLVSQGDPIFKPAINLYRSPTNPFLTNSTLVVSGVQSISNSGSGAYWTPFESFLNYQVNGTPQSATNVHQLVTMVDPTTGKTRLIASTDQGVFTAVDNGQGGVLARAAGTGVVTGSRNGNLQLAQFYSGASEPGATAATTAGSLFLGISQDNGLLQSDPSILADGNLQWGGFNGTGTDVHTDASGSGTSYYSEWPCCVGTGGLSTDFFQVDPSGTGTTSRTFGLFAQNNGGPFPDPQWPAYPAYNFAVNPIDGQEMIMGSGFGRLYATENQGKIWYPLADPIANPGVLDGSTLPALAYGAPDPNSAAGVGSLDNYILVGTTNGNIYVTFNGGGSNAGNPAWTQISNGLDGSTVKQIATDPTRGTHDAYAVTTSGVFYNPDTSAVGTTWTKITGNLFTLAANPFGDAALAQPILAKNSLDALAVDWRYVIPNNPAVPTGPSHPMIYVAGNGGIFRSTDNGADWTTFPDSSLNPSSPQGVIPSVNVTGLSLALGNVDPTTGHPDVSTGPNILLASTYGQGAFAIRLAPIVFNDAVNTVALSSTLPAPNGSDSGSSKTDKITNVTKPVITGLSEQTAFGNLVAITIIDATNPAAPFVVGGYDPATGVGSGSFTNPINDTDAFGRFAIQLDYSNPSTPYGFDGLRTLQVFATDASGTKGNVVNFQFTLVTRPPAPAGVPVLEAASDSGYSQTDNYTNVVKPVFDVAIPGPIEPGATLSEVLLFRKLAADPNRVVGTDYIQVGMAVIPTGSVPPTLPVQDASNNLGNGQYTYAAEVIDLAGNTGPLGNDSSVITIDTTSPLKPGAPVLDPAPNNDTGTVGDGITANTNPVFNVTVPEFAPTRTVLLRGSKSDGSDALPVNTIIGATTAQKIQDVTAGGVPQGVYYYFTRQVDLAGNPSVLSLGTRIQILTQIPGGTTAPTINVYPSDLSGGPGSGVTNVPDPRFYGTAPPYTGGLPLYLDLVEVSSTVNGVTTIVNQTLNTVPDTSNGQYLIGTGVNLPDATYVFIVQVRDVAGNVDKSAGLTLTISTVPPKNVPNLSLLNGDGYPKGSSTTVLRRPHLVGVTDPNVKVSIVAANNPGVVLATTTSGSNGYFSAQLSNNLSDGVIALQAFATNAAGNKTQLSNVLTLLVTTSKGDYNDDGVADLGVYTPPPTAGPQGLWTIGLSGTVVTSSLFYGAPGDVPIPGDFNGDGVTDYAVYRPSTSQWIISPINGNPYVQPYGVPGKDIPVPAGYDTNGQTDVAVYSPGSATWSILHSGINGLSQTFAVYGYGGLDQPAPADYNGVGSAQLAVYRPAASSPTANDAGNWYVQSGLTNQVVNLGYKLGDIPVPADYDGIGRAEQAVYRPSTGQFIVYNVTVNKVEVFTIPGALSTDIPVPEDYTGSGRTDPAVFNQAAGTWKYLTPAGAGFSTTATVRGFAVSTRDVPLPAPYVTRFNLVNGLSGGPGGGTSGGGTTSGFNPGGSSGGGGGGMTANAVTLGSGGGSGSGGSSTSARMLVVGAPIPGGGSSTGKGSARPNVAISKTATLAAGLTTKAPAQGADASGQAISSLGRSINGKFF